MHEKDIPAGQPKFDLTDEVNANWRDNLRKNPLDPRYRGPGPDLTETLESVPEPGYPKPKRRPR